MISKKKLRVGMFVLCDIGIVCVSAIMQLVLRFGIFTFTESEYLPIVLKYLPLDCLIAVAVLVLFKLYNRVWSYASIDVLEDVFLASIVIEILYIVYKTIFAIPTPRSFYIFDWMSLFLLLCVSRIAVRIIRRFNIKRKVGDDSRHMMIVGGGQAGMALIREMKYGQENVVPVCVIDDNPEKLNSKLGGVPIVGNRNDIPRMVIKYDIDEIVIAMPSTAPSEIRNIISICETSKAKTRIMPAIAASINGSVSSSIRDISYEDLLQRDEIVINNPELSKFLSGKTVMVTGGGGSIGSELCRQILSNHPDKLVLVDIYENSSYSLEHELKSSFPLEKLEVRIGSIRDYDRMNDLLETYKPDVIYHAAAHKHVPLMEDSPNEAIKNNCLGTLNMVKLADKHKVGRFVMISTDKAVNPTNVMGATKRICEMIIQTYNNISETEFVAVRFGNVLGSNGSVIPLFLKQIERGGPVTLTHREITRFFMTIPEAVSLVLTAGLMAKGGEIFVLDMGEPVKIYDLAVNLIRMKGLIPEEDIGIEIVGLRPGEKLYEELLMDEEGLTDTENKLIHIGKPIRLDEKVFLKKLGRLIEKAEDNLIERTDIMDLVPTYHPGKV